MSKCPSLNPRFVLQFVDSPSSRSAFTAFRPTIFGQRDPHLHAQRKRIVSHGYSMNALQSMEKFVQERVRLFMGKMATFSSTGERLNLGKWCHFFAFDVIGELVSLALSYCLRPDYLAL